MNIIEFNLLMSTLSIFALAASLFVLSTITFQLNLIAVTIRLFVSGMLALLYVGLLVRFTF